MSYKLQYPYTEQERVDFIVEHNHNNGRLIHTVDNFIEETKTEEVEEEREITEEREIIETREVVNEETGEITYEEVVVGTETVVIGTETVVVEVEVGTEMVNYPTYYALEKNEIWDEETQQPIIDEDYEEKQKAKERERIGQLNMTRGDFIEGLILAQGKDEKDIIALIEALPINEIEKKVYINRVNNALDFYRGYPVIDVLCGFLNVPLENMDKFFETKDYNYLKPVEVE